MEVDDDSRANRSTTRRTVLSVTGLAILGGGFLSKEDSDGDVEISVDEDCSNGSIEMRPPDGETWTGAIEIRDEGSELALIPPCGQTVSGGSTGDLEVSLSSPGNSIRRAFVVEGPDLEGPVVAEETCGTGDEDDSTETDGGSSPTGTDDATSQTETADGERSTETDDECRPADRPGGQWPLSNETAFPPDDPGAELRDSLLGQARDQR